ncbi:glycosyltransferase family 39 protein [Actinomadura sp. 6N118]|uniref:glycosyltransferase family 39 protein n=1 Tax=Actinomadura sp. 6N118 TaxID=3375151 RepID=UPI003799FAB4
MAPGTNSMRTCAVPAFSAAATLVIALLGISGPSFWLDEAATISMTGRSLPDLERAVHRLDLVHFAYYLIMKPWVALFGDGELALRLPSAVAMAAGAAGVVALGRRVGSDMTGLVAGICYATSVTVTRYAQEARPFAMVTATAVLATYLLVRALQATEETGTQETGTQETGTQETGTQETRDRQQVWLTGYAVVLVFVGLFNIFGLLLVAAHAITLLWTRVEPRLLRRWLVATAAALVVLAPFVIVSQTQKAQVASLQKPTTAMTWSLVRFLAGGERLILVLTALLVIGMIASRLQPPRTPRVPGLSALAVPWLFFPPVFLLSVSFIQPMFRTRYVLMCVPALVLLVAAGLVALGQLWRPLTAVALVAVLALTVPGQLEIRKQDERIDDLRAAADIVRERAMPGDGVLFLARHQRWRTAAYADAYKGLTDLMVRKSPAKAANLDGEDVNPAVLATRLCTVDRVWLMDGGGARQPSWVRNRENLVQRMGLDVTLGVWRYKGGSIKLVTRSRPADPGVCGGSPAT